MQLITTDQTVVTHMQLITKDQTLDLKYAAAGTELAAFATIFQNPRVRLVSYH